MPKSGTGTLLAILTCLVVVSCEETDRGSPMQIVKLVFGGHGTQPGATDCYDTCFDAGMYCLEFYSAVNGYEYSCGKGEGRQKGDALASGSEHAIAKPGDTCVCIKYDDNPNVELYPDCTPEKECPRKGERR